MSRFCLGRPRTTGTLTRTARRRQNGSSWVAFLFVVLLIGSAVLVGCDASSSVSVVNDSRAKVTADINDGDRTFEIDAGKQAFLTLPVNYRIRIVRLRSDDPSAAMTSLEFIKPIPTRLIFHFNGVSMGMSP